ncbi:MAG: hypothetical protein A2Y97_01100 [Nitrospirae bacterium RBG_13_39_12]|nr:MAG: hypothetical protein A2Y97_01100 [Nitrospirae bacterium RBG_13_39_12]
MKRFRFVFLVILIIFSASAVNLYAGEQNVSGSVSVDVMSNYVWRGQKLSNSWVVQPSVSINYGSFSSNIWANYDTDSMIDEGDGHGEITETDITANYNFSFDKLTIGIGYIYYALNSASDTQEIYVSASYDILPHPSLTFYYDYDEGKGTFIVASIKHSFDLAKDIPLELGASASFNIEDKVMGTDSEGDEFTNFYNSELKASVSIPLTKGLSVTPKVAYSFPLSNDAEEAIKNISDDGDKDIFYGGLNLTLCF